MRRGKEKNALNQPVLRALGLAMRLSEREKHRGANMLDKRSSRAKGGAGNCIFPMFRRGGHPSPVGVARSNARVFSKPGNPCFPAILRRWS